ncbi:MAG: hypothetical protein COA80_01790 [Leeuwenhoekiella sp.]|nr:MAG: hypothetical protein COA80_01790 [Leeuwenhoekiella sp.]
MKKTLFFAALFLTISLTNAQNFEELANFKFESAESYKPAEPEVLQAANYLFENPANVAQVKRLNAVKFILNWMQGTPDYTFEISNKATELTKGNPDLLGLYMAAMTKVVLDNPEKSLSNTEIYNRSEELLVSYCANSENNMKPSRKIKKLIKNS